MSSQKELMKNLKNKPSSQDAHDKRSVYRKCSGCGEIKERENLVKITRFYKTGEIFIQPDSKCFGRSVYICYNNNCLKEALKKKRMQKTLKKEISPSIIKELESVLN